MRIDQHKYDLVRARNNICNRDIATAADMSITWVTAMNTRIKRGANMLPRTVGQIAAAIGCRIEDIISNDDGGKNNDG